MRYFMGVHKFAPTLAVMGDLGWEHNEVCWAVAHLWNRILALGTNRTVRKIFEWNISSGEAWAQDMSDTLVRAELTGHFQSKQQINITVFEDKIFQHFKDMLALEIYRKT